MRLTRKGEFFKNALKNRFVFW